MHQVRASHILLETEARAREVLSLLDAGELFDQLAKTYSKCPSSRDGGDLGWFTRGMMLKPFEDVCLSLREGEIVGPVKTESGYHIIKLTGEKIPKLRVLITSDLHFELTGPEPIRRLVAGMDRENPDLIVIAGDIGNPLMHFTEALRSFVKMDCPVAVIPGNHDLWTGPGETSILLYEELLPAATREYGFHWLEGEPIVLNNGVAICGSIGWYDYSAKDPKSDQSDEEIRKYKDKYAADAYHLDWEYDDCTFAANCRKRLEKQLEQLEADDRVSKILVVTHVPCFESQLERNSEDPDWTLGTAYFGHLTLGDSLRKFGKVRWAVSGHTHIGMNGIVERPDSSPIATAVVGSDYAKPRWVTLEL